MSRKPYTICTAKPGKDGKTFWTRIGTAWPDDKGGFNLQFDALPIPSYSDKYGLRVEAKIFPPREDDGSEREYRNASNGSGLDDGIPY